MTGAIFHFIHFFTISSFSIQVKLNDLPLLPLLVICEFLRTDGSCKDLNNFRKVFPSLFCKHLSTILEKLVIFTKNVFSTDLPLVRICCEHIPCVSSESTCDQFTQAGFRGGLTHQLLVNELLFTEPLHLSEDPRRFLSSKLLHSSFPLSWPIRVKFVQTTQKNLVRGSG